MKHGPDVYSLCTSVNAIPVVSRGLYWKFCSYSCVSAPGASRPAEKDSFLLRVPVGQRTGQAQLRSLRGDDRQAQAAAQRLLQEEDARKGGARAMQWDETTQSAIRAEIQGGAA